MAGPKNKAGTGSSHHAGSPRGGLSSSLSLPQGPLPGLWDRSGRGGQIPAARCLSCCLCSLCLSPLAFCSSTVYLSEERNSFVTSSLPLGLLSLASVVHASGLQPSYLKSLRNLQCFLSVLGGQTQSSFHTRFLSKLALLSS